MPSEPPPYRTKSAPARSGWGSQRGGLEQRVTAAADLLERLGGDVEVARVDDVWMIRGLGCPLSGIVGDHAEACALAESLVATITDRKVTECCDRENRPRCAFRIEEPRARDAR